MLFILLAGNPPFQLAKKVGEDWSSSIVLTVCSGHLRGPHTTTVIYENRAMSQGDWWFNAVTEGDYDRFWRAHRKYAPHFPLGAQVFLNSIFQPNPQARQCTEDLLHVSIRLQFQVQLIYYGWIGYNPKEDTLISKG